MRRVLGSFALGLAALSPVHADVVTAPTHRISGILPPAADANGASGLHTGSARNVTHDGRTIVFHSSASNLVPGDGGVTDVFMWSRVTGATTRVSGGLGGAEGNGPSLWPSIADDGRVVFESWASNLVPGDTNNSRDVFVRDPNGSIQRVSVSTSGDQSDEPPASSARSSSSISANGRFVVFESRATNLIAGDTNGRQDIFMRDTCYKQPPSCVPVTIRVSVANDGTQSDRDSFSPSVSGTGTYVAFATSAALVSDPSGCGTPKINCDTNNVSDVYVRDTFANVTYRASWPTFAPGPQPNGENVNPSISANGRYVAFESLSTFMTPDDQNASADVFLRDMCFGAACTPSTTRVSGKSPGEPLNARWPSVSADGRYVAYSAGQPGAFNTAQYVFVWDRDKGAGLDEASRAPLRSTRVPAEPVAGYKSTYAISPPAPLPPFATGIYPSMAGNGSAVVFASDDPRLDPADRNTFTDVFVRQFVCQGASCVIA